MDDTKVSIRFGGLGTILSIIFMVLKLTGNIDWPWVWVFAPFWIPLAIIVVIIAIPMLIIFIDLIIEIIRGY